MERGVNVDAMENQYPWRVGRRVSRTIYQQLGPEPSDADPLIGVMDSPEIASHAVVAHNEQGRHRFGRPHRFAADTQPLCQHHKWPNDSIDAICGLMKEHPIHRDPSPWLVRPFYDGSTEAAQ
jgi:hypothetical protein